MGKYLDWITDEGLMKIESWARDGLSDEQIAHNIGIRRETLYDWKKKYTNFSNALKKGKEVVDIQVENALLKRALGFEYDEVKEEFEGSVLTKKTVTKKIVVGDTTAQIFWLKNRRPTSWRNDQNVIINPESNEMLKSIASQFKTKIETDDLSDED